MSSDIAAPIPSKQYFFSSRPSLRAPDFPVNLGGKYHVVVWVDRDFRSLDQRFSTRARLAHGL
jgi:hypothetical protein